MDNVITSQKPFVGTWDQFSLQFPDPAQLYQQELAVEDLPVTLQYIGKEDIIVLYVPSGCKGSLFLEDYLLLFSGDFLKIIIIIDSQELIILYENYSVRKPLEQLMHIVLNSAAHCVYVHHFVPISGLKTIRATQVTLYNNTHFEYNVFYAGDASIDHYYKSFIRGKHVQSFLRGVYCATKKQVIKVISSSLHYVSDSQSLVMIKGIVTDQAHVLYKGFILIQPEAHTTQASQENGTLILSDNAFVNSVPVLEVLNNEVQCAHASAVGRLDDSHILYLRSRGFNFEEAQRMVIKTYVGNVFRGNFVFFLEKKLTEIINLLPLF